MRAQVVSGLRRGGAQPVEAPWNLVGEVAEVLSGHPDVKVVNAFGAEVCDGGLFEARGQVHVVVHVGIALTDFQISFTPMGLHGAVDQGGDEVVCAPSPVSSMDRKVPWMATL